MRGTRHDHAVWIALDNLGAHLAKVVHKVEAGLKHLFEEEAIAAGLSGEDNEDAHEVGWEGGPGSIAN